MMYVFFVFDIGRVQQQQLRKHHRAPLRRLQRLPGHHLSHFPERMHDGALE